MAAWCLGSPQGASAIATAAPAATTASAENQLKEELLQQKRLLEQEAQAHVAAELATKQALLEQQQK